MNHNFLQQLNNQMSIVVDRARQGVVQIHGLERRGRRAAFGHRRQSRSQGAGTIIHAEGLVVTNAHVVRGRSAQVTLWDGRTLDSRLLAYDEGCDLAALAVDAADLPTIPLRNGRPVQVGEWVVALGHPWGVTGAGTAGMVIAGGRPLEQLPYDGELLQVSLQLRPGHSGGPMLDGDGRLVGINTMISGPQVGLAVPLLTVKRFLKEQLGRQLS